MNTNTKELQKLQGKQSWLGFLVRSGRMDEARTYANRQGLAMPTGSTEVAGGAGVDAGPGAGNYNAFTPPDFFSNKAPSNKAKAEANFSNKAEAETSFTGTPGIYETKAEILAADKAAGLKAALKEPTSIGKAESGVGGIPGSPGTPFAPAREALPEGVKYALVISSMLNRRRFWCEVEGVRGCLWIGFKDLLKLKRVIGRTLAVVVNPDVLQGGWVLWRG